jgi:hypothetical protein
MNQGMMRSRWAAVGAAVALCLGAGGIRAVNAAVEGGPVLVSITPCRLADTRPESGVGPRRAAVGPGDTYTLPATGANGQCSGIPADAVALSMNVTGLGATAPTFLTLWPAGAPQPEASSLNLSPGAAATPNAVVSGLGAGGQLSVYNLQGSAHVIIDVNGYYVDHQHDDRYLQIPAELDVNPFDLQPTSQPSGWTRFEQANVHAASVGLECIAAPLDVPDGVNLRGVDVAYASVGPGSMRIRVVGLNRVGPVTGAAPVSAVVTPTWAASTSPTGSLVSLSVSFPTPVEARPGLDYLLQICTRDSVAIGGATIAISR